MASPRRPARLISGAVASAAIAVAVLTASGATASRVDPRRAVVPVHTGEHAAARAAATAVGPDSVVAFGGAGAAGTAEVLKQPQVGMAATADGQGYWTVASDGGVFNHGDAAFHGSAGNIDLAQPVVAIAGDPATGGYWLVAADGGVFSYDAPFYGSEGGVRLDAPIVAMAATSDGKGYWLVAADGGVFSFGNAAFHGSEGGHPLARPVVGMAADRQTGGYWLVASDGGIFSFDAGFHGSMGSHALAAPVTAMAASPDGGGYWLLGSDGGIFNFGDAHFAGSAVTAPAATPAVGMAAAAAGYWVAYGQYRPPFAAGASPPSLTAAPGGGPATFGPTGHGPLTGDVVALDPGHNGGNAADAAYIDTPVWNGVSLEACDTTGTETDSGYTEATFNFDVVEYLAAVLRAEGATVVVTRTTNTGVGPCITERAAIGNAAHAEAAVSVHADGGPPGGRGFAVLEPVADGINDAIVAPSSVLGADLRHAFAAGTGEPVSNYDGVNGIQPRDDLGGTNLSTVPKVFIETANMRNSTDASLTESLYWQGLAADAIAAGLETYLTSP